MIPLDDAEQVEPELDTNARRFLSPAEWQEYHRMSPTERRGQLRGLLERPIARFSLVNEVYFRSRWAQLLQRLHPGPDLRLLEVATGDADCIPQAMQRIYPRGIYVSANQNEKLNESFRRHTAGLSLDMRIVAADAAQIAQHAAPESFDVVAFQHGLNDVVQAILCARAGVDTVAADWMETLPRMIAMMQEEVAAGTLEQHARQPLLDLLQVLLQVLKKKGVVAMNHYQFQLDLDWGYPPALFENFIPIVRGWLQGVPGMREIRIPGFAPQWWLFLEKI
jgi:hypothetical protein